jgi:hypothetical protein
MLGNLLERILRPAGPGLTIVNMPQEKWMQGHGSTAYQFICSKSTRIKLKDSVSSKYCRLGFPNLCSVLAKRLLESYGLAVDELRQQTMDLEELEAALNVSMPGILQKFRKSYEERGGEQFRPDQTKVQCLWLNNLSKFGYLTEADPSKVDVLETLKCSEVSQQTRSRSRLTATSLVMLANEGVDLEIEWC